MDYSFILRSLTRIALAIVAAFAYSCAAHGQQLDAVLQAVPTNELAAEAKRDGDAARGAVVFFGRQMACSKCHATGDVKADALGPDLAAIDRATTDASLVESVLTPSKVIRKGFASATVQKVDGSTVVGVLVLRNEKQVMLREVDRNRAVTTIDAADIDSFKENASSIMPQGQVDQLNSRQQFLDLIRYLMEIRDGGAKRAAELQPAASLLTFTVPEYEQHLDHAALVRGWNGDSLKRGEAIYQRVCANCHGTRDRVGSLPTSLRFAEGKFKNGSDPLSMYRTITYGFGLMAPQTWMVPSQKYDVIHYIREEYLKRHNPTQFVPVDEALIARLPKGNTRGPAPSNIVAWSAMDYGPSLTHTYEIGGGPTNFAYKGVAVRLDPGAGGVSRGRHWMVFDEDTLRVAAGWNATGRGENFIDWQGIQFNGSHNIHPHIAGQTAFANATGPGWADPARLAAGDTAFKDDARVLGRDGRRYGPLPRQWAKFRGLYHHGQQVVLSYSVGNTEVLETPGLWESDAAAAQNTAAKNTAAKNTAAKNTAAKNTAAGKSPGPMLLRTLNIGPRDRDMVLQVAEHASREANLTIAGADRSVAVLTIKTTREEPRRDAVVTFDGKTYLQVAKTDDFDTNAKDFTVTARIKTKQDGTIWAVCQPASPWTPDGQSLFVRGGRLSFDIGWVGVVTGKSTISDDKWHDVAATWHKEGGRLRLYVDGKLDAEGSLAAKHALPKRVMRIGFTTDNFPEQASHFRGEIAEVCFWQRRLTTELQQAKRDAADTRTDAALVARWKPADARGTKVDGGKSHEAVVQIGEAGASDSGVAGPIVAGVSPSGLGFEWISSHGGLRLRIPAGAAPLRFTIWQPADAASLAPNDAAIGEQTIAKLANLPIADAARDLTPLTHGGPARWAKKLQTQIVRGRDDGPFATDVLTAPEANPWLAQTRFTGLDFMPDGRIAVCTWDGDVWLVEAAPDASGNETVKAGAATQTLTWQRIATGMFQPLGLKVVDGKIYVTCRDQLTVLHDLNGDDEIDFYECLNNDHQVTEHFHEFAMGLQTDAAGNFYYAKSGRHGLPAVVPQHGTLLRISKDGSKTEILATGFRAANGVCLNPDGSFVVTDQEGFWNPKNRINWVTAEAGAKPKFYGNMWGYTDVTDTSDVAMEPPLCWITNAFDRSPAELLWVDSKRWGPLDGSLLNLSYGYGKVYVVPHEKVGGQMQGGMIELPIPSFPTGVMRGRFRPSDQQLYLCGMFAWAGSATQPGGLYRLRATGKTMTLPVQLHATKRGVTLVFTSPIDRSKFSAKDFAVKTWTLKRSANYGSEHYDEKSKTIRGVSVSEDGKTVTLDIAELAPTWCMEIKYALPGADGATVRGMIHNTIHRLAE